MTYEFTLHLPGFEGFEKKTGYPIAYAPVSETFEAASNAEALTIARAKFREIKRSSLDPSKQYHFNVGRAA